MGIKKHAALVAAGILLWSSASYATTATVSVGFNNNQPFSVNDLTATTVTPVINIIQMSTELDSFSSSVTDKPGTAEKTPVKEKPAKATVGLDFYISNKQEIYALPMNYAITPNLIVGAIIPVLSAKYSAMPQRETGVGDISMTVKYLLGSEETVELISLLTGKFASGDETKGLGTGSYDIAITEKLIKHFDRYRFTLMGGYIQPLNDVTIQDAKISYGGLLSYMGAAETNVFHAPLWLGVKFSGIHSFASKVNSFSNQDALTTFDITPEAKYFFTGRFGVSASVIVPVSTSYDVPGSSRRDVVFNFGLVKAF